jgi:hypothetical protein
MRRRHRVKVRLQRREGARLAWVDSYDAHEILLQ